jgi:hypothetical protein
MDIPYLVKPRLHLLNWYMTLEPSMDEFVACNLDVNN